jgi:hypothetical protein
MQERLADFINQDLDQIQLHIEYFRRLLNERQTISHADLTFLHHDLLNIVVRSTQYNMTFLNATPPVAGLVHEPNQLRFPF